MSLKAKLSKAEIFDYKEKLSQYKATLRVLKVLFPLIFTGFLILVAVENTIMEGYVLEWLNLLIRWAHVVAGIMWIGAFFLFHFFREQP